MSAEIKAQVRAYILEKLLPGEDAANLKDDLSLTRSGVLDSVSTLELVSYVEEAFGFVKLIYRCHQHCISGDELRIFWH